jgi:chaperonin cofactor prefoldin
MRQEITDYEKVVKQMSDELERLHSQINNLKKQRATDVEKVMMKNI